MKYTYISSRAGSRQYKLKGKKIQQLINEALHILKTLGIPFDDLSARRKEKMGMAFLAVVGVGSPREWEKAQDQTTRSNTSRDLIKYINSHFGESISSGSYDDIRRKDLARPYMAGLLIHAEERKNRNDPTRKYCLNPVYTEIVRSFGQKNWEDKAQVLFAQHGAFAEKLNARRNLELIPIVLPSGEEVDFVRGDHNLLQKETIEEFLPRFGHGAEVLYVGDTAAKFSYLQADRLNDLGFFELGAGELPDVVAYSKTKNWIFLIEAVHSANPISNERRFTLAHLLRNCTADPVYVTVFQSKKEFRKHAVNIAWETEVWIAQEPDHLIHFNGDKFLGPHQQSISSK